MKIYKNSRNLIIREISYLETEGKINSYSANKLQEIVRATISPEEQSQNCKDCSGSGLVNGQYETDNCMCPTCNGTGEEESQKIMMEQVDRKSCDSCFYQHINDDETIEMVCKPCLNSNGLENFKEDKYCLAEDTTQSPSCSRHCSNKNSISPSSDKPDKECQKYKSYWLVGCPFCGAKKGEYHSSNCPPSPIKDSKPIKECNCEEGTINGSCPIHAINIQSPIEFEEIPLLIWIHNNHFSDILADSINSLIRNQKKIIKSLKERL